MKSIKNSYLTIILLFFIACKSDDNYGSPEVPIPTRTQLVVVGQGPAVGQTKIIVHPITGEVIESVCFLMDMIDAKTGEVIGTLQDCDLKTEEFEDGTLLSRVLTTFNLEGRGSITSENQVFQAPINDARKFSTLFEPMEDNIVDTSFEFEGGTGRVSMSGDIDLSNFDSGIIVFNCTFTIDLETLD